MELIDKLINSEFYMESYAKHAEARLIVKPRDSDAGM